MEQNGIEAERLVRRFKEVTAVEGIDLTVVWGALTRSGAEGCGSSGESVTPFA